MIECLKHARIFYEDYLPYIEAVYELEDETGIYELTFNKIEFPLSPYRIPNINLDPNPGTTIDVPNGLRLFGKGKRGYLTKKLIKSKVREMTLEEIEKELGYPVKIVSKGEKK